MLIDYFICHLRRKIGVIRELACRAEQSVLRWFETPGEIREELVGEENSRIRCKRYVVERKTKNGIDGKCVKSIE